MYPIFWTLNRYFWQKLGLFTWNEIPNLTVWIWIKWNSICLCLYMSASSLKTVCTVLCCLRASVTCCRFQLWHLTSHIKVCVKNVLEQSRHYLTYAGSKSGSLWFVKDIPVPAGKVLNIKFPDVCMGFGRRDGWPHCMPFKYRAWSGLLWQHMKPGAGPPLMAEPAQESRLAVVSAGETQMRGISDGITRIYLIYFYEERWRVAVGWFCPQAYTVTLRVHHCPLTRKWPK